MLETGYFAGQKFNLSYSCTIPNGHNHDTGVIFVHAAHGNKLGPHRMFVEFAQQLCNIGIASFRFDMRGCGDSEGEAATNQIDADQEDLLSAIDFVVTQYHLKRIFLFGISRGSRVCFATLSQYKIPVAGAILLSTPFSSSKAAIKSFSNRLKEYWYKCKNPNHIKKLLTGKANIRQISNTFIFALGSKKRYTADNITTFATPCPILFIFGQKDPIAGDAIQYYSRIAEQAELSYNVVEIENANHSYFHYQWKIQIFQQVEEWLLNQLQIN